MSDHREQVAQCEATAVLKPDDVDNLWKWGHALLNTGNAVDARAKFERIVHLEPNDHESWHAVGVCCARADDQVAAIVAFRRALDLQTEFPECWADLGDALAVSGSFEDARQAYESGLAYVLSNEEAHVQMIEGLGRLA